MLTQIIEAENELENLLPKNRLDASPSSALLNAALKWSGLIWTEALRLGPAQLSEDQQQQGFNLIQHPVFICGVHRSGTTLVQNLLDGHPQLLVLPSEGTFYTNLELKLQLQPSHNRAKYLGTEWLRRMVNPVNQPPYFLLGRSDEFGSPYVDFARCFLAWWHLLPHHEHTQWPHSAVVLAYASCTNNLAALHWVDKTPTNERFLNRIWQEFPRARIIQVVRNPIATLTSRKVMEPSITLRNALRFLKISYQVATDKELSDDSRFFLLRYEELCDSPERTIAVLADFLSIANTSHLKQASTAGISVQANSSFKKDASCGDILKSAEHKQHDVLTAKDQKLIAAYLGNKAALLGYQLDKPSGFSKTYTQLKHLLFR
ncbi:sulfotransferase family protein [Mucilaginibacter ximonensis]|uniref:Sulfotransferase family protein n=1 Tax=Mucilaginibacter ximonensis TaxID=538021 RepID=A0ABW5Y8D5_9SPHI